MSFKNIRITVLLLILTYVGFDSLLSNARVTNWKHSLRIVIYPINADGSAQADEYISGLKIEQFEDIQTFIKKQSSRYGLSLSSPLYMNLSSPIKSQPPKLPESGNVLSTMWWSIKLRYWSWKTDNYNGVAPHIRAYALFYDPKTHQHLKHSTGLKNGKLALIKLFADGKNSKQNNFVMLHEILHTLGASDKYNLETGLPSYPEGFAEPERSPLYPQKLAEIMGGKISLSETKSTIPNSLKKVLVGAETAQEIGWIKP
jgi:hypothetical protein